MAEKPYIPERVETKIKGIEENLGIEVPRDATNSQWTLLCICHHLSAEIRSLKNDRAGSVSQIHKG